MRCPSHPCTRLAVWLGAVLLLALPPHAARADEFPRLFESARGVSMGDALTAVADSFDAMFYNPAGLSQSQDWRLEARHWQEESRDDGVLSGGNFFDGLDNLRGKDPTVAQAFLSNFADRPQSVRSQTLAGYHTENGFGIAWVDTIRKATRPAEFFPEQSVHLTYDRISGGLFTLAYASELRLFMWGVTLKYLTREAAVSNVTPDRLVLPVFDSSFGRQGNTEFDYDAGIMARLPFPFLRPTIAVALLNGRAPDFGLADVPQGQLSVPPLERELNVGLSFQPDLLPESVKLIVSFETRDINETSLDDTSSRRRESWGAELSLFPQAGNEVHMLKLRVGNNQNQSAFGVGFNLADYATIDFVSSKEELAEGSLRDPQHRRMIQLTVGF
jgi:hypothetical protein